MSENLKKAQSIAGYSKGRPILDFYPTPAYASEALFDFEDFKGLTWECACGDGSMSKVLIEKWANLM